MTNKAIANDVSAFLSNQGLVLSEFESSKLADVASERISSNSILGEFYFIFKELLQEKCLTEGLKNCFKRTPAWNEKHRYAAFTQDYKIFDDLSNYYGNQYRGSFIFIYLMGALAVLAALIPVGFAFEHHFGHDAHHYSVILTAIELVMILMILIVNKVGANPHGHHTGNSFLGVKFNRRWHQRWIEYRILAERFRYMEILYPIGVDPLVEGSARKNDLNEWINVYYAMRLSQVKTERGNDQSEYKARLLEIMTGQSEYHQKNAQRSEHIHHRLHTLATWLFYGTMIACASHFIWHNPILTLASGFLPAVAAAMHGILANGEFNKAVDVSERMHHQIDILTNQLKDTSTENEIREIAIKFHNIVIGEALSWRAMFKDKNVPLA